MVRNPENLEQALRLRERGFTLQEIAKVCEVSKSTVSKWLCGNKQSAEVTKQNKRRAGQENAKRLQLFGKARQVEREKRYQAAEKEADVSYKHFGSDPLFVAGLMLYSGNGDRQDRAKIRLSSGNIASHRIWLDFMSKYMSVERSSVRAWLVLYPDMTESECMKQWSKKLRLPYSQFYKTQIIPGKSKTGALQFGAGNTIIVSTVLKRKLNRWIELAEKHIK